MPTPWIIPFPSQRAVPTTVRPRPPLFRALGKADPPQELKLGGETFECIDVYKHDSWAATALYARGQQRVVCKFNRRQSIFGLPMAWLGRWLARREAWFLRLLEDTGCVPRVLPFRNQEQQQFPHAVARGYILGDPLGADTPVGDAFFAELSELLESIHERGLAYVDLHKRENVLVGDDGHPYLIDFQVAYAPPAWMGPVGRMLLRQLQQMDRFNCRKLQWKFRPNQVAGGWNSVDALRPTLVTWHRKLAQPLRAIRRWLLIQLRVRQGDGRAESEVFAEAAFRPAERKAA